MSRQDKEGEAAGEASMDEILASIRKIIADDTSGARSGPDQRAVNPLFESSLRPADAIEGGGPLLPPAPRFDEALRAATATDLARQTQIDRAQADRANEARSQDARPHGERADSPPPFRRRPFIDQALAGLLDEPTAVEVPPPALPAETAGHAESMSAAEPESNAVVQTEPPSQTAAPQSHDPWAAWRNLRNSAAPAQAATPAQPPLPPLKSTVPHAPAGVVLAAPSSARTAMPSGPTPPANAAADRAGEPVKGDATLQPTVSAAVGEQPQRSSKPAFYPPAATPPVRRQPATFSSVFPRDNGSAPLAGARDAAPIADASGSAPLAGVNGAAPAPASHAAAQDNRSALNGKMPAGEATTPQVDLTMAAAADQALAKLAAGISEATSGSVSSVSATVASPHAPSQAPAARALPTAAGAASVPQPAPVVVAGSTRTLDDMVSDMLRPMLEKWVESNMPRLMEKALRPIAGPSAGPGSPAAGPGPGHAKDKT